MISIKDSHAMRVDEIAAEFQSKGYEVARDARDQDLLRLLGGYRPDLIAMRDDDRVVIEIKKGAEFLPASQFQEIARRLRDEGGWRFLLFSVDPSGEDNFGASSTTLSQDEIADRIQHADNLLDRGESEAAFLLYWSIFEALVRRRIQDAGLPIDRLRITALMKHLYSEGDLSWEQVEDLQKSLTVRNGLAHGLKPEVDADIEVLASNLRAIAHQFCEKSPGR